MRHSPCCLLNFCVLLVRVLQSNLRIRDEELQAAGSERRNSWLAGDSMRVCYHSCVRGTAIGLGVRRDRGLKLGRAKGAIQMYDELQTQCSCLIQACAGYCRYTDQMSGPISEDDAL